MGQLWRKTTNRCSYEAKTNLCLWKKRVMGSAMSHGKEWHRRDEKVGEKRNNDFWVYCHWHYGGLLRPTTSIWLYVSKIKLRSNGFFIIKIGESMHHTSIWCVWHLMFLAIQHFLAFDYHVFDMSNTFWWWKRNEYKLHELVEVYMFSCWWGGTFLLTLCQTNPYHYNKNEIHLHIRDH